ncbi:MAG: putative ABC transporter permease [Clostridiales bacterium]|nr:putative ABC transporter permease [Clostridiales bacterium]
MEKAKSSHKTPIFTKEEVNSRKIIKMYDYDISHLWLASLVFAHIGYWVENLFRLISKGILDSRNQLLPFLFCYSIAMWALYLALGTPKKARFFNIRIINKDDKKSQTLSQIYYFCTVFFFVFFGEIVVGFLFEKISGIQLWNYSGIPLHVTQYTSVPTCTAMSLGVMILMEYFFTPLMKKIQKIPYDILLKIDYIAGALIVADYLIMTVSIMVFKTAPAYWTINFRQ